MMYPPESDCTMRGLNPGVRMYCETKSRFAYPPKTTPNDTRWADASGDRKLMAMRATEAIEMFDLRRNNAF